jgi:hypothetical protein
MFSSSMGPLASPTGFTCAVQWLIDELGGYAHDRALTAFIDGFDHATRGTTADQILAFIQTLGDVSLHLYSSVGLTVALYKPELSRVACVGVVIDNHIVPVCDTAHRKDILKTESIHCLQLQASDWFVDYTRNVAVVGDVDEIDGLNDSI